MYDRIKSWVLSQCQGNVTISRVYTPGQPTMAIFRGGMQANGVLTSAVQRPTGLDPYSIQARKGIENIQGKVWKDQNPEHCHPVLIKFIARFLQNYSTNYFARTLL